LIKLADNLPLSATLKTLSDGLGNDSVLALSTNSLQIGGTTGATWDDTNKRLGIGTNAPTLPFEVTQNVSGNLFAKLQNTNAAGFGILLYGGSGASTYTMQFADYNGSGGGRIYPDGIFIGAQSAPTARLQIQGSGATSATTSLLVQNSAGNSALQVQDNLNTTLFGTLQFGNGNTYINNQSSSIVFAAVNSATADLHMIPGRQMNINNTGTYTAQASALLQVDSTTKGFLPPRMTTTQKNAIATPAAGLMVYDTTLNKLCVYTTAWETITSI
jgi:hypothetical protein